MELRPTPEQERLQSAARAFAKEYLATAAARFEENERVPAAIYTALAERGLMAVNVEPALGGSGAGAIAYALSMMEIAQGCASTSVTMAVTNMVGGSGGRVWQRRAAPHGLPAARQGLPWSVRAERSGSRKRPRRHAHHRATRRRELGFSMGPSSGSATGTRRHFWWCGRARDGTRVRGGLSCFLVPGDADGLSVTSHEDKMGLRASHTVSLTLENVRVPASALLGPRGGGFRIAMMGVGRGAHRYRLPSHWHRRGGLCECARSRSRHRGRPGGGFSG